MIPELKEEIEDCVEHVYHARGRLGTVERERFNEGREPFAPMPLDFEKRYAVALAEVNALEKKLRELTGPTRDLHSSLTDAGIAHAEH